MLTELKLNFWSGVWNELVVFILLPCAYAVSVDYRQGYWQYSNLVNITMDYDDIIELIGDFGTYQKRLLLIVFFPVLFNSFSTPVSNFLVGDIRHRCKIPDLDNDTFEVQDDHHLRMINDTIPLELDGTYKQCVLRVNGSDVECQQWVYDKSVFDLTVISQFDLVCENTIVKSHAVMTYFMGHCSAPLIMNALGDVIGRRLVVCIAVTSIFIVNIAMPFSTSVYMFAIARYFDGFFGTTLYASTFIIGVELVGVSKRVIAGTVILLVYCGGEYILVVLAYFIRDWRWLQLTLAVPMVIPLIYWWPKVLPESARWLISKGRISEALVILRRAAKVNKTTLPEDKISFKNKEQAGVTIIGNVKQLVKSKKHVLFWGITSANWFVISFIYYGIKLNIGKLGGNLYVSFALIVTAETIGYSLLFLMDIVGHKRLHMISLVSTCTACIASIFPIMFADQSFQWITVMFALLGKMFVSLAFGMIYVYTNEIFPTVIRSFVLGTCSFFARLGSLSAPYLYLMAEGKLQKGLPLILYGVIITIVTLLTIMLPDKTKQKLPDHVKDVRRDLKMISKEDEDLVSETSPL